jgi:hypothetical protein
VPSASPTPRPGWLTAFGIIAVVLGSFGIVGNIQLLSQSRLPSGDIERQFTQMVERLPGMRAQPKELQDALKEAVPGIIDVGQRRAALAVADMLLSVILLIGALRAMRLLPSGRWLWLNASLALIPIDVLGAVMQTLIARDTANVLVAALVKAGDVPQAQGELAKMPIILIGVVGVMHGLKALGLTAYYAATLVMLTRARHRALFEGPAPPPREPPSA